MHDPTAHFLKAVSTETGEIVSIARWHRYLADARPETAIEAGEKSFESAEGLVGGGVDLKTLGTVYGVLCRAREEWMVGERGYWGMLTRCLCLVFVIRLTVLDVRFRRQESVLIPLIVFLALTILVTRAQYRGQGAGGMLVRWGTAQADAEGVPAYLEASPAAKHLYETQGFKQVGQHEVDLNKAAGIDSKFRLARMKYGDTR